MPYISLEHRVLLKKISKKISAAYDYYWATDDKIGEGDEAALIAVSCLYKSVLMLNEVIANIDDNKTNLSSADFQAEKLLAELEKIKEKANA